MIDRQSLKDYFVSNLSDDLILLSDEDFKGRHRVNKDYFDDRRRSRKWLADELKSFKKFSRSVKDSPEAKAHKQAVLDSILYNHEGA